MNYQVNPAAINSEKIVEILGAIFPKICYQFCYLTLWKLCEKLPIDLTDKIKISTRKNCRWKENYYSLQQNPGCCFSLGTTFLLTKPFSVKIAVEKHVRR